MLHGEYWAVLLQGASRLLFLSGPLFISCVCVFRKLQYHPTSSRQRCLDGSLPLVAVYRVDDGNGVYIERDRVDELVVP
jgi:hypothetical protein